MTLFNKCIRKLGNQCVVMSEEKSVEIFEDLQKEIPFTFYGRVDWDNFIQNAQFNWGEIPIDQRVFILWDNAMHPERKYKEIN
ncbi:hypothetical protein EBB07_17180 [Paenibacillaceae bacterium]|nr:hypothetical protein EBB07_17180 [Paenibacillaceae bacterium]